MGQSFRTLFTSVTSGELDPLLQGRVDISHYYSSASKLRELWALPQGGFRRRPALAHLDILPETLALIAPSSITTPNGGTGANANDLDDTTTVTTTTGISTTNPYVVVRYDLGSAKTVKFADAVKLSVDSGGGSVDEWAIQWSTDDAAWNTLGTLADIDTDPLIFRRAGPVTARYWRVARIGSTDLSTAVAILGELNLWEETGSIGNFRLIPFHYSDTELYLVVLSDRSVSVYRDGALVAVQRLPLTHDKLPTLNWAQSEDTLILVQLTIAPLKLQRQVDESLWTISGFEFDFIPKYDFEPATETPDRDVTPDATTGQVKLTLSGGGTDTWDDPAHLNQRVEGNGGLATIVQINSTTEAIANVLIPFYNTDAISTGDWIINTGFVDAWNPAKGFPVAVTFHQGRLWFGGGSRPQTIWGSRVSAFGDFEPQTALDDEPIEITLDTDQRNTITNLISNTDLIILTELGEFYVPSDTGVPITPLTAAAITATRRGSKSGLRSFELDGATVFVQRQGKAVRELTFDELRQRYRAPPLTLLSSHLIVDPVDICKRLATNTEDADVFLAVNSDGTVATLATVRDQDVIAWTLCNLDPARPAVNCASVDVDLYLVNLLTVDGTPRAFLSQYTSGRYLDHSLLFTAGLPTSNFSLPHLPNTTLQVRADGNNLADVTTDANGDCTIERDAETSCEIGFGFAARVQFKTNPLHESLPDGTIIGVKKRIPEVTLDLFETGDIIVNGNRVSFRMLGGPGAGSPLDNPVPIFTGRHVVEGLTGFDDLGQVEITQGSEQPMTVVGFAQKVRV